MGQDKDSSRYEQLGREMAGLVGRAYGEVYNLRRQIWVSFVKGVFTGLGWVVGATLMVALLLFLLQALGALPFVGELFRGIRETLQQKPV